MTETTPALDDARLAATAYRVVRHERVNSLEEAAVKRGVDPSAVIKTMVVRLAAGDYVFALVPGDRVIDWAKLRTVLGERRLSLADADEAFGVTGYVRGTITPFGSTTDWPVYAAEQLASGAVSIGGGAPGVSVTIDGRELVAALSATLADFTKTRE